MPRTTLKLQSNHVPMAAGPCRPMERSALIRCMTGRPMRR
jgi:hypothetical protein